MPDEIDDLVRAAATTHEGLAPAGYFDDLDRRVLARLDRSHGELADLPEAVSMMSETENNSGRDRGTSPEGAPPRDREDSGLHDMRALAQTTKARISRRITSQHDAIDDSLASSSSGLRAVALPEPARLVALPNMPLAAGTTSVARIPGPAPAYSDSAVPPTRRRKTGLLLAMGAGLFAVAVGAVVVLGGGSHKSESGTANEAVATGTAAGPAMAVRPLDTAAPAAPVVTPTTPAEPSGVATGTGAGTSTTGAGNTPASDQVAAAPAATKRDGRDDGATRTADKPADRRTKPEADRAGVAKPAKEAQAPAAAPGAKPATAGGNKSIEDLLDEASGGAQKPSDVGAAPKGPEKTGLDGKDIKAGMSAVAGRAQACFDTHGVAGHVKVKATVDASGKVTKADATGEFAGTPTGGCVANAARSASFPSWTGGPMTISYMFTLQE